MIKSIRIWYRVLLLAVVGCLSTADTAPAQVVPRINPYAGVPIARRPYRPGHFVGNTIRFTVRGVPANTVRRRRRW